MVFWSIAAAMACLVVGFSLWPLMRRNPDSHSRESYDIQVYRDQLREIDADLACGILTTADADAARAEIGRKILAADAVSGEPTAAENASKSLSLIAGMMATLVVLGGTYLIYHRIGAAGLPDQPIEKRLAERAARNAELPGQAEIEAQIPPPDRRSVAPESIELVERLEDILKQRPDDLRGHRLLARAQSGLGWYVDARQTQEKVVAILGSEAQADDWITLADLGISATGGYVSPEMNDAIARALELDPENELARYYSGLALAQRGRADLAYPLWVRLLRESPEDAPWIAPIRQNLSTIAAEAGERLPPDITLSPGPTAEQIENAEQMSPADRQAMIEGMVAQLGDRLAREGGPAADWAQLIRALRVLDRNEAADEVETEAREIFANDAAAIAVIDAAGGVQ